MNSLLQYLFTSSWLLGALMLGYLLLLQNQKLLLFKRFYLLGSLLLCLLHPLLPFINSLLPDIFSPGSSSAFQQAEYLLPEITLRLQEAKSSFSASSMVLWAYLGVAGLMLLRFFIRMGKLGRQLRLLNFHATAEGILLTHTKGPQPTFSFFRFVVINTTQTSCTEEYQLILQHETAHARQLHSTDILLAELTQALLWFHPAIYLLNKAIRHTHEHLADASALKDAALEDTYLALMARQGLQAAGLQPAELPFTSTFFQSITINRIRMIKKSTPGNWPWRITASLLLSASLTTFIGCEKQQEQELTPPPPPQELSKSHPNYGIAPVSEEEVQEVFDIAEEEAKPAGGMEAFYQHLWENIKYPQQAIDKGIEGTAYIRFVVDQKGNVISAESVKGRTLGHGLDEEAIRIIKTTKWIPAKQGGKTVQQRKILPISFKL